MKKRKQFIILITIAFVLAWITALWLLTPGDNLIFGQGDVLELNDGWYLFNDDGSKTYITLPTDLGLDAGETCTISNVLSEDFPEGMTICIRASLQSVQISLDGEELLNEPEQDSDSIFYTPIASAWYLLELPENAAGKTLTISFQSPYSAFSGYLNSVLYGSGVDVACYLARIHWVGLAIIILISFVGLALIIVSAIVRSIGDKSFLYLGLFAVGLSGWFFAESKMMQFFVGSQFLIGGLAYMMLTLFPIPMIFYLKEMVIPRFGKVFNTLAAIFFLNFIAVTLLQMFGIAGFFTTAKFTNLLLLASILFVIAALMIEIVKYKNKNAIRFTIYTSFLLVFALIELIHFYQNNFDTISLYSRIGMLLFVLMLGIDSGIKMKHAIRKNAEAELYERMAYTDILTGGKNRAAFEKDIDELTRHAELASLRLVMIDLNNLKAINDQYGHQEGDHAIKMCYECMNTVFTPSEEIRCYRFGGDEFLCLMIEVGEDRYREMRNQFLKCVEQDNQKVPYEFSVAIGSTVFNEKTDDDFSEFFRRTDQVMYQDKIRQKNTMNIKKNF